MVALFNAHALQLTTLQHQESGNDGYFKQTLNNFYDMSYSADMKIGRQTVDAILDTGSFDVEVISKRCGAACEGAGSSKYYDRQRSHTYVEGDLLHKTSYGSGDVYAESGAEAVAFGTLKIPNQQFWEVVSADLGGLLESGDFQAIVGVGPPGGDLDEVEEEATLVNALKKQFQRQGFKVPSGFTKARYIAEVPEMKTVVEMLNTTRFSVCLGRKPGSAGHFVWNDHDPSNNDAFQKLDMAGKATWGLSLSNAVMKHGVKRLDIGCHPQKPCAAIVDSGTSLLTVPTPVRDKLFKYLQSLSASCEHMDRLPTLEFHLGGKKLSLPPSSYMGYMEENLIERSSVRYFPFLDNRTMSLSGIRGPKSCELLIGAIDIDTTLGPMWILGMPFFRKYYTTFELGADQRDSASRTMFVAEVDDNCRPQKAADLGSERQINYPLTVKPNYLRVPKWAAKSEHQGRLNV